MSGAVGDDATQFFGELKRVGIAAVQVAQLGDQKLVAEAHRILTDARKALYRLLAEDEAGE